MDKELELIIKEGEKRSRVFSSTIKAVNSTNHTVDVIMSDASIDRYREVIDPRAWKKGLANYKKHPVLLSSHNYHGLTNQIGKAETIKVNKEGQLEARMKYFVGKGNDEADWGFFLAEEGVAAYSVGFIPKKYVWSGDGEFDDLAKELGYSAKEATKIDLIFTEVELLENSHVLVPANPAGLLKGMESEAVQDDEVLKSLYTEALDKIDSFKDFFATEGAATISKSFDEGDSIRGDDKRVKRVKKKDSSSLEELLAAVKDLDTAVKGKGTDTAAHVIDDRLPAEAVTEILESIKALVGDSVVPEDEEGLESGGPASPDIEGKDAADLDSEEVAPIIDAEDADISEKDAPDAEDTDEDSSSTEKDVDDGIEDKDASPEVKAIKDATDAAIEKINLAVQTAIEQFSSLTLESTEAAEKIAGFENELSAVKNLLTDLEESKIELKEAEAITSDSMKELLAGIKDATAKISAREVPSK